MNYILKTSATIAIIASLAACDKIDKEDRYIDAEMPETGRKVLVEEFTGQLCINCPDGHENLNNIRKLYGDNVVTVSIHAGQLSLEDETFGLKTQDGETYANRWSVQAYPCIGVNRQGTIINNMPQWQDAVMKQMGQVADVHITLTPEKDGDVLNIKSSLISSKNVNAKYQLWITESNIKAPQMKLNGSTDLEYVHNHVYRASINGIGGEDVSLESGVYNNISSSITINNKWNADYLSVVAFVYDNSGVFQAEEVSVNKLVHE